jgi:hypothetical protein
VVTSTGWTGVPQETEAEARNSRDNVRDVVEDGDLVQDKQQVEDGHSDDHAPEQGGREPSDLLNVEHPVIVSTRQGR